ncbi:hypothetical protein [Robertmurraya siralis]|uniref:hypothetical protein n=1 Tax=Robertmurraya siralis TaxID=77777 RepID=UPI001477010A|nr:hypothetical protein [Robertmurraya siralis]
MSNPSAIQPELQGSVIALSRMRLLFDRERRDNGAASCLMPLLFDLKHEEVTTLPV